MVSRLSSGGGQGEGGGGGVSGSWENRGQKMGEERAESRITKMLRTRRKYFATFHNILRKK